MTESPSEWTFENVSLDASLGFYEPITGGTTKWIFYPIS